MTILDSILNYRAPEVVKFNNIPEPKTPRQLKKEKKEDFDIDNEILTIIEDKPNIKTVYEIFKNYIKQLDEENDD